MVSVRIRGIYATALSKILLDAGLNLVEISEKIRNRLGVEQDTSPCDVTVKDTENPDEILVIGFPEQAKLVRDILLDELKYVFKWEAPVELHSIYVGKVISRREDQCIVDISEGLNGLLYPCREEVNSGIIVGVKKTPLKPDEKILLTRNFRLVGKYLALIHGDPKISFSEHILDRDIKARLTSIAVSRLIGTSLGIHFRSSSKHANEKSIIEELNSLLEEYRELLKNSNRIDIPVKVRSGEYLAILELTSLAKSILDETRRRVSYTIDRHHSLKSMDLSNLVDFAETVYSALTSSKGEETKKGVLEYLARSMMEKEEVVFMHIKPTGEVVKLNPGIILNVEVSGDRVKLLVKRIIKSSGIYDGLGLEKKQGDIDYLIVDTSKPAISHNYYRGDSWLGTYININTYPELAPGIVKYHDLLVDVIIYPHGEAKIIDMEELEKLREQGIVTKPLYDYAQESVKQVLRDIKSYVFKPNTIEKY